MKRKSLVITLAGMMLLASCQENPISSSAPLSTEESISAHSSVSESNKESSIRYFKVSFSNGEHYRVTHQADPNKVQEGDPFTFQVDVDAHYHIVSVKADETILESLDASYTIPSVTRDTTVAIQVDIDAMKVTLEEGDHYTITPEEGYDPNAVDYDGTFAFRVTPEAHYHIVSVKNGENEIASIDGIYKIENIQQDIVVSVEVAIDQIEVALPSSEHYIVAAAEGYDAAKVDYGSAFAFRVTPSEHYHIVSVKDGDKELSATDGVYTIEHVTEATNLSVTVEIDKVSVVLPSGEHYTVTAAEGYDAANVNYGAAFAFRVTPSEHYHIVSVKAGETVLTAKDGIYTIEKVTVDPALSVEVSEDTYALTLSAGEGCTVNFVDTTIDGTAIPYSKDVAVKVIASTYYEIQSVTLNGVTLTVAEDGYYHVSKQTDAVTLSAVAVRGRVAVTLPHDEHYTIARVEGLSDTEAEKGLPYSFTVTPGSGYYLKGVTVNGEKVTANDEGKYVVANVTSALVVAVDVSLEWVHYAAKEGTKEERGYYEYYERYNGETTFNAPQVYGEATSIADTSSWSLDDARWNSDTLAEQKVILYQPNWSDEKSRFVWEEMSSYSLSLGKYQTLSLAGHLTSGSIDLGDNLSALDVSGFASDHSDDGLRAVVATVTRNGRPYQIFMPVLFVTGQVGAWPFLTNLVSKLPGNKGSVFGYYEITADLGDGTGIYGTSAGVEWNTENQPAEWGFRGTIDGQNHSIKGKSGYQGLFGELGKGALIKNLTFEDDYAEKGSTSLLATFCHGAAFENVTFKMKSFTGSGTDGAAVAGGNISWIFNVGMTDTSFKNCVFDAEGKDIGTLFGSQGVMNNADGSYATNYTAMHVTFISCTLKAKSLLGLVSHGTSYFDDWQYSTEHADSWAKKGLTFIQG